MNKVVCTTAVAVIIGVTSMGVASATPVPTYNGDPVPSSSEVIGVPTNGPLPTGFGTFVGLSLTDINLINITTSGGNEVFTYTDTENLTYLNPSATYVFTNGQLQIEVLNRNGLFQPGTFSALLLSATFSGPIQGVAIVGGLSSSATGTVTYTSGGPSGLMVDTSFVDLPSGNTANGGPFILIPLNATTSPSSSPTPLPAALPLFGGGLALVGWLARRRNATAARVAA